MHISKTASHQTFSFSFSVRKKSIHTLLYNLGTKKITLTLNSGQSEIDNKFTETTSSEIHKLFKWHVLMRNLYIKLFMALIAGNQD